mgnify:CR=1 FL=1
MRAEPGTSGEPAPALGAALRERLRSGSVWVQPGGVSMRPTILPGDSVHLVRAIPKRGSIALVVHDNRLWLHRLVRHRRGRWLLWGDARPRSDGWIDASQIVAVVRAKRGGGRVRDLSGALPRRLGCARAAEDPPLRQWLRAVVPQCRWLAASSTGTVIVAAAGLLDQHAAATHWLAGDLLGQYGSTASAERIVEIGNVITCEGEITAMHVALLVTLRLLGPSEVTRVRAELDRYGRTGEGTVSGRWWRRRPRRPAGPQRPRNPELVAPDVIEFEPLRIHPR